MNKNTLKLIIAFLLFFVVFDFSKIFATDIISSEPNIDAKNAVAIELKSGNILFNKDAFNKIYPASTTKILTAILTIENVDLDKIVTCSSTSLNSVPLYSSTMSLKIGETISVKNLLYGMLLHSGNDAANVLAEVVSGSIDDFIKLMNDKLKEIGCTNTNFVNAHGFHDEEHFSTPYDMAKLMKYAIENETFREIICTDYIQIPATNKNKIRKYTTTNKLLLPELEKYNMYYKYCLGGKTGYTDEAQGTFVGYAKKDNLELIVAVFNSTMKPNEEYRFIDSKNIFDYCFNNTKLFTIQHSNNSFSYVNESNKNITYTLNLQNNISTYCIGTPTYSTDFQIKLKDDIKISKKTVADKTIVGYLNFSCTSENFNFSDSYPLICTNIDINYKPYIIKSILFFILISFILRILYVKRKKRKRKNKKMNIRH